MPETFACNGFITVATTVTTAALRLSRSVAGRTPIATDATTNPPAAGLAA
jgi:hypothetical protein